MQRRWQTWRDPIHGRLHPDASRSYSMNIDKFIVLVGKWAEPILDELTGLIEQEFSLPYFEFVYDYHWDLGHGWFGDMPK